MPEIRKKSSKKEDRFTATSDLRNDVERVSFRAVNRQLSQQFSEKVYSPQVPKNWGFPVNSFNFKGIQLSMQYRESLQKSSTILVP